MPIATHLLHGRTLILLSNREPYEHVAADAGVEVRKPAGGLVSALDPTLQRTHGTWVAWGSGTADRDNSDVEDRVQVPPDDPSYTLADPLRQVPLDVPVWAVHARDDDTVPFSQAEDYVTAARQAGGEAFLVEVAGGHFGVIDPASDAWAAVVEVLDSIG